MRAAARVVVAAVVAMGEAVMEGNCAPVVSEDALERIRRRMDRIDNLPPMLRAVIHEYGWECVKMLMDLGATKPRRIESIIRTCRGIDNSKLPICDSFKGKTP